MSKDTRFGSDLIWLIGALLMLTLMVTARSLWIDEAQTATYAKLATFGDFIDKLARDNRTGSLSEGLMPLSMFLAWICGHAFGVSEWWMRVPNVIYLGAGFFFAWRVGVALRLNYLVLLVALHPFVWYYADEARPYALQIALGCALLWSGLEIIRNQADSRWGWLGFLSSSLALSGSSLLCIIPVSATGLSLLVPILRNRWRIPRHAWATMAVFLPLFLALGAFYYHALHGSSGAKLWPFGASNLVYAIYEGLGFQGLGPGRTGLREAARGSGALLHLFASYVVPLAALAGVWLAVGVAGLRAMCVRGSSHVGWILSVLLISLVGFVGVGVVMKFPFWGRHLSPLLPFVVTLAALCCREFQRNAIARISVALLALLWATSSACIRLDARFDKDDYRGAADLAKQAVAAGERTWWCADTHGANFYGLFPVFLDGNLDDGAPPATGSGNGNGNGNGGQALCRVVSNASKVDLEAMPEPKWVFLSKPDIYDNAGAVLQLLKARGYVIKKTLTSFEVWTR